jgi:hypothetical protein
LREVRAIGIDFSAYIIDGETRFKVWLFIFHQAVKLNQQAQCCVFNFIVRGQVNSMITMAALASRVFNLFFSVYDLLVFSCDLPECPALLTV